MSFADWWRALVGGGEPASAAVVPTRTRAVPAAHPRAYDPSAPGDDVFDPALRHFRQALRKGDPSIDDPDRRAAWASAREDALVEVVARIARSELRDALVLRGGLLTRAWFGDLAREPKDIDFVVLPDSMPADSGDATALLDRVVELARQDDPAQPFVTRAEDVSIEKIWTYERAEGRRVVVPCARRGAPDGEPGWSLQIDLVFRERLRDAPGEVSLRALSHAGYREDARDVRVLAASMRESLAWKLLWLVSDISPQGKDLYDAVLLAESLAAAGEIEATCAITREVVAAETGDWRPDIHRILPVIEGEWLHLRADQPSLAHLDPRDLHARLVAALAI